MTLAQYQANGNSCADNSSYSSTLPSNGAPKCIKITGFSIPVKHAARIRLNFHFRLKGTDGWNANSQQLFYAGFVFRAATSVNFGSNVQTIYDATGLVGAGKKATAIGGYVFDGATPGPDIWCDCLPREVTLPVRSTPNWSPKARWTQTASTTSGALAESVEQHSAEPAFRCSIRCPALQWLDPNWLEDYRQQVARQGIRASRFQSIETCERIDYASLFRGSS